MNSNKLSTISPSLYTQYLNHGLETFDLRNNSCIDKLFNPVYSERDLERDLEYCELNYEEKKKIYDQKLEAQKLLFEEMKEENFKISVSEKFDTIQRNFEDLARRFEVVERKFDERNEDIREIKRMLEKTLCKQS